MTKVIAIARGHDGVCVREEGEQFTVDMDDKRYAGSTWFVPVDKAPPPKVVKPNARPPGAGPKPGSAAREELA